jgi:hypothetical protein
VSVLQLDLSILLFRCWHQAQVLLQLMLTLLSQGRMLLLDLQTELRLPVVSCSSLWAWQRLRMGKRQPQRISLEMYRLQPALMVLQQRRLCWVAWSRWPRQQQELLRHPLNSVDLYRLARRAMRAVVSPVLWSLLLP